MRKKNSNKEILKMESKSNKTSQIVYLIIGIVAFIAIFVIQTGLAKKRKHTV